MTTPRDATCPACRGTGRETVQHYLGRGHPVVVVNLILPLGWTEETTLRERTCVHCSGTGAVDARLAARMRVDRRYGAVRYWARRAVLTLLLLMLPIGTMALWLFVGIGAVIGVWALIVLLALAWAAAALRTRAVERARRTAPGA